MSATTQKTIPGYVTGTWDLDPTHTEVGFAARHLMVSKVRGRFTQFSGSFVTADNPLDSSIEVEIDLSSIDTGNEQRDGHLKSADFFALDAHPKITYRSTGIRPNGDDFVIDGDLTLNGVTKPVSLDLEVNGFGQDPWGGTRAGFTAKGELNRKDFGVNWNAAVEGGGVVIGDRVQLNLEVEAVLRQS